MVQHCIMKDLGKAEKRRLRKQKEDLEQQNIQLIRQANSLNDIFDSLKPFSKYERKGVSIGLEFYTSSSLPKDILSWCMEIMTINMKSMYDNCEGWGWNPAKKLQELKHKDARFIIVCFSIIFYNKTGIFQSSRTSCIYSF